MKFLRRLNYMLHQRRAEADLAEEIEFHRAMSQKAGQSPSTMGNIARAREDARAAGSGPGSRASGRMPRMPLGTSGASPDSRWLRCSRSVRRLA